MSTIVNGQRIVTPAEFLEVAGGFDFADVEPLDLATEFTAGGLMSRDAMTSFLDGFQVETDADREDARYYRRLLRRMPRELRRRKPMTPAPVAPAAEVADWTGADFDSYEVLASVGAVDPAGAVSRARQPRAEQPQPALRLVHTAGPGSPAAVAA
ncbi:hypothetical protein ACJ6WD_40495 [Streptomyces sp. VTCC 41912]|uniref:hypothetical protein n=1 Tax=Streptomyces sp. VTCC 41912 TaxID=3383243 RepID=UPI0038968ACD